MTSVGPTVTIFFSGACAGRLKLADLRVRGGAMTAEEVTQLHVILPPPMLVEFMDREPWIEENKDWRLGAHHLLQYVSAFLARPSSASDYPRLIRTWWVKHC